MSQESPAFRHGECQGVRTTGQLKAPASLGGVVDDIIPNMAILLSKEEPLHGKFAVNLADYSKL